MVSVSMRVGPPPKELMVYDTKQLPTLNEVTHILMGHRFHTIKIIFPYEWLVFQ